MTPVPPSDGPWSVLGLIVTGVFTFLVTWRTTGGGRQPGASTAKSDKEAERPATTPVAVPTADGRTEMHDLPASLAGSLAALSNTVSSMQRRLADQAVLISELQRSERLLVGYIDDLHTGIEDGTIPPMPPIPPDVADRLR